MNAPLRGLEHLGARAGWGGVGGRGLLPQEQQGSAKRLPQPPSAPWGRPYTPHHPPPAPHLRLCLLAPAGRSWGSEEPRSPHLRPANSEKCETWGEGSRGGKAEAGSLPSLWKNKELASSQRPLLVSRPPPPTPPLPPSGGKLVFCVSLHLYLYLCPSRSPTFPWLQKSGYLCRGHPHSVPLPFLIPSRVSQSPTSFGVVLHGFAVLEEMETQQSLKLVPRGQADGSRDRQAAGGVEKGRGR